MGIKTYSFKPGFPHELELTSLKASLGTARDMVTAPHRTDFHQILWVRTGKPVLLLDFKEIRMQPGSLLFIRKNRVLMFDRSGKYDGHVLLFTDHFFIRNEEDARYLRDNRLFSVANERPVVSLSGSDAQHRMVIGLLERELAAPVDAAQHAALQNLLHNFLILCERRAEALPEGKKVDRSARDSSQRFVDLVEAGFRKEKKVSAYAAKLGVTEKRLQAATAEVLGKAPKALIDERVALEARRMLLYGGASVKEIGFELGFEETTNFVKYFRKHAGTTPADFRARYQGR